MRKDVMIDFETLATTSDAVVLSIGVCIFDRYGKAAPSLQDDCYMLSFEWTEQAKHGRRIMNDTVAWWLQQDPEVRDLALVRNDRNPGEDLLFLSWWLQSTLELNAVPGEDTYFWAKGTNFDLAIMQDIYNNLDKPYPWFYRNTNDCRNLIAEYTALVKSCGLDDHIFQMKQLIEEEKLRVSFKAHNPQHDAWLQAYTVWLWTRRTELLLKPEPLEL